MKGIAACLCALAIFATAAVAQESESTTITTTTTGGGPDLLGELWAIDDATIQPTGSLDLRLTDRWGTGANTRGSGDDFSYEVGVLWGMMDNVETSLAVGWTLGEGEVEGNGDLTVGVNWRFAEPDGTWPAMALKASARLPSGYNSSGVDGQARLILTNEYDSGIRSHVNGFIETINNNNDKDDNLRDFGYGVLVGLDGPLCSDGAVRWVADYMWRNGRHDGSTNHNQVEIGWEWQIEAVRKFGVAVQISLDRASEEPDFGASFTYSRALTF